MLFSDFETPANDLATCRGPKLGGFRILADVNTCARGRHKRVVIASRAPTEPELKNLLEDCIPGERLLFYTASELRAMSRYSLKSIETVAEAIGPRSLARLLGVHRLPKPDRELRMIELRRKIVSAVGPLDDTLLSTRPIGDDRVRLRGDKLKECLDEGRELGIPLKHVRLPESYAGTWEELFAMKGRFLELLRQIPKSWPETITLKASLVEADRRKFGYVPSVEKLLGDNVLAICAYGSSVTAPEGSAFGDYDNWVIVRDVRKAYEQLGKEGVSYEGHSVHMLLLPEDVALKYLYCDINPLVHPGAVKVLSGMLTMPLLSDEEIVERGKILALHTMLQRRNTALSALTAGPGFIVNAYRTSSDDQKCDLFNNICQSPLRLLLWADDAARNGLQRIMTKSEVDQVLHGHGLELPRYPEDAGKESVYRRVKAELSKAIVRSARLFEILAAAHPEWT